MANCANASITVLERGGGGEREREEESTQQLSILNYLDKDFDSSSYKKYYYH